MKQGLIRQGLFLFVLLGFPYDAAAQQNDYQQPQLMLKPTGFWPAILIAKSDYRIAEETKNNRSAGAKALQQRNWIVAQEKFAGAL